ncbi:MAG: GNAT family protein [Polyangiaceae bacterium]
MVLRTARLNLLPMTMAMVEAVLLGHREEAERLARASMPERWPNPALIERAFSMSLESIRAQPSERLWGARVMVFGRDAGERRVIGSVVFRGQPAEDGLAEIAYGVEEGSQGRGYATEAVGACVGWALEEGGARVVQATTFAWHHASIRVLEKVGMARAGTRDHDTMGEMIVYERKGSNASQRA